MLAVSTYISSKYFLDYELLNKYKIFNLSLVPKIEKLNLTLSISTVSKASLSVTNFIKHLEIKLYVLLYILFSKTPKIHINNIVSSRRSTGNSFIYYLKTSLMDSDSILEFLISTFFESWHKIKKEELLTKVIETLKLKPYSNSTFYFFKVFTNNIAFFKDLAVFFNLVFDFKEVFFSTALCLKHPINLLKPSGIKSFPFFWIND
jgi:hypothetical protein